MPFYKIFFLLITFNSFIINANEENSIIDEYRVENTEGIKDNDEREGSLF